MPRPCVVRAIVVLSLVLIVACSGGAGAQDVSVPAILEDASTATPSATLPPEPTPTPDLSIPTALADIEARIERLEAAVGTQLPDCVAVLAFATSFHVHNGDGEGSVWDPYGGRQLVSVEVSVDEPILLNVFEGAAFLQRFVNTPASELMSFCRGALSQVLWDSLSIEHDTTP